MTALEQPVPSIGNPVAKLCLPSYAAVLGVRNKTSIKRAPTEHSIGTKDGFPAIFFSRRDVERAKAFMKEGIILKFAYGQKPPLSDVRVVITRDWGLLGDFTLGIIDYRHILLKVQSEEEVVKVLARERKYVKGCYFQASRWSIDFDPKKDSSSASFWVDLPGLKLHHYHPDFLVGAAQAIGGTFLKTDEETICQTRAIGARFCLEMDLLKDMPEFIYVAESGMEGYWQKIKYPKFLPLFCVFCSKKGHSVDQCRVKSELMSKTTSKPSEVIANNVNVNDRKEDGTGNIAVNTSNTLGKDNGKVSDLSNEEVRELIRKGKLKFVAANVVSNPMADCNEEELVGVNKGNGLSTSNEAISDKVHELSSGERIGPTNDSTDVEKMTKEQFTKTVRDGMRQFTREELSIVREELEKELGGYNVSTGTSSSEEIPVKEVAFSSTKTSNNELANSEDYSIEKTSKNAGIDPSSPKVLNVDDISGKSSYVGHSSSDDLLSSFEEKLKLLNNDQLKSVLEKVSCFGSTDDIITHPFELVVDIGKVEKSVPEFPIDEEDGENEVISDFEDEPPPNPVSCPLVPKVNRKKLILPLSVKTRAQVTSTSPRHKSL